MYKILDSIRNPEDIKNKSLDELTILSDEIRLFLLENILICNLKNLIK